MPAYQHFFQLITDYLIENGLQRQRVLSVQKKHSSILFPLAGPQEERVDPFHTLVIKYLDAVFTELIEEPQERANVKKIIINKVLNSIAVISDKSFLILEGKTIEIKGTEVKKEVKTTSHKKPIIVIKKDETLPPPPPVADITKTENTTTGMKPTGLASAGGQEEVHTSQGRGSAVSKNITPPAHRSTQVILTPKIVATAIKLLQSHIHAVESKGTDTVRMKILANEAIAYYNTGEYSKSLDKALNLLMELDNIILSYVGNADEKFLKGEVLKSDNLNKPKEVFSLPDFKDSSISNLEGESAVRTATSGEVKEAISKKNTEESKETGPDKPDKQAEAAAADIKAAELKREDEKRTPEYVNGEDVRENIQEKLGRVIDFTKHIPQVEDGKAYLIYEPDALVSYEVARRLSSTHELFIITRGELNTIRKKHMLQGASFLLLRYDETLKSYESDDTDSAPGVGLIGMGYNPEVKTINPLEIEEFFELIKGFADTHEKVCIVFDDLLFLIVQNGFRPVLKLIQQIMGTLSRKVVLLISADVLSLDEKEIKLLSNECDISTKMIINGIVVDREFALEQRIIGGSEVKETIPAVGGVASLFIAADDATSDPDSQSIKAFLAIQEERIKELQKEGKGVSPVARNLIKLAKHAYDAGEYQKAGDYLRRLTTVLEKNRT